MGRASILMTPIVLAAMVGCDSNPGGPSAPSASQAASAVANAPEAASNPVNPGKMPVGKRSGRGGTAAKPQGATPGEP